jgi:hypothetical protein
VDGGMDVLVNNNVQNHCFEAKHIKIEHKTALAAKAVNFF